MILKKINNKWWMLESKSDIVTMTWFGYSKEEVLGRFNSYIQELDLEKIRYTPKGIK